MKALFSCSKRFVALVLALLLMVPAMAMPAFAADPSEDVVVTDGALIASNYTELTEAEKNLLKSGQLDVVAYSYNEPDLVEFIIIDTDSETVWVKKYTDRHGNAWEPVEPALYDGEGYEVVDALTYQSEDAEGYTYKYVYDGNAFSVRAKYALNIDVNTAKQEALLNAGEQLQTGLGYLKAGYDGSDTNIGTVVLAMEILSQLADGYMLDFGMFTQSAQFGAAAIAAVENLEAQIAANGDQLDLQLGNAAYAAAGAKTQYLMEQGVDYLAVVQDTYVDLAAISGDPLLNNDILDEYLANVDTANHTKWMALKSILSALVAGLEPVSNVTWTAPELSATVDYVQLDTLVAALPAEPTVVVLKESLKVAETENYAIGTADMFNVVVNFALYEASPVVDSDDLIPHVDPTTVTVTLLKDATRDEILAEILATGVEATVLSNWDNYVSGQFIRTETTLPDTLTEDCTYTVTYVPALYEVTTNWTATLTKRYGAQMTLPVHANAEKSYDYTIGGEYYAQGSVITITGETNITRSEGKAYTEGNLYQITADNYFELNSKGYNILTSGALKGNEDVPVRYPDNLVTITGTTINAPAYPSSYAGLEWMPYSYVIVVDSADTAVQYFGGATTADITEPLYDSVKVTYRLTLTNLETKASNAVDLVYTLVEEAADQKYSLDRLNAKHDVMGQLDKTKLGALSGVIGVTDLSADPAKNVELQAYFTGVVGNIIANSVDTNNNLKIYNILGQYQAGGLSYYYNNYSTVINEINALSGYLTEMLADDEKKAALSTLCTAAGFPEYVEKIEDLEGTMAEVKASLTAPDAAIDLTSPTLNKLTNALAANEAVTGTYTGAPVLDTDPFVKAAANKASFEFTVSAAGVNKSYSKTFMLTAVLSAGDIAEMKAGVDAAIAELNDALGENKLNKYYTGNYNAAALDALVGQTVSDVAQLVYTYNWTPNEYTVYVDGMGPQTITINDLEIDLAAPGDANLRYDYTVDGAVLGSDSYSYYTFTLEQIDRLFTTGTYSITRNVVDLSREKLENFVASVNAEMGKPAFALVEEAGVYTGITAHISTEDMMGMVMGLTNGGYGYIGLGGSGFIYFNDDTMKTEASLQTLVDAMLNNGALNNDTIIDLGNGDEVNLLNTTIDLGNNAGDAVSYTFTVYMTDETGMAAPAAAALAQVQEYVDLAVAAEGGVMTMTFNLPTSVYELYLAGLLLSGEADVADINAVSEQLAYEFMLDYIHALSTEGVTAETIMNTTAMLGKNVDLTGEKGTYMNMVLARMSGLQFTAGEGYTYVAEADNDQLLSLLSRFVSDPEKLSMATGLIKECQAGNNLVIKLEAAITNFDNIPAYEAIVIDSAAAKAAGMSAKLGAWDCTEDLAATLAGKTTGTNVVVLQADITGNLVINTRTALDLNGHTITGNITVADGVKLIIIDSHMDSDVVGSVIGTINGADVNVMAGYYSDDVSAFLKPGYEQEAGFVRNTLYTIDVDSNGNVTFNLDAAAILGNINPTKAMGKALGLELAADLLVNYYTSAALSVDTMDIYSANLNALLTVYTGEGSATTELINQVLDCLNLEGLNDFINDLVAKLNSFGDMATAVAADEPIASYTLTTSPWLMQLKRITSGNYLDVNIVANGVESDVSTVSVVVTGSDADKADVVELFTELGTIITSDIEVEITDITYNGGFAVAGSGYGNVTVGLQHNPDYAAILGIIVANAGVNKPAFVAALNEYFASGDLAVLRAETDNITFAQLVTALKALNRSVSFDTMVNNLGVNVGTSSVAELDKLYRNVMVAAGYALEVADVTGGSQSMASLGGNAIAAGLDCGTYVVDKYDVEKEGSYTFGSYTAHYNVAVSEASLVLKIFAADLHNYSDEYTSDADGHWHVCIIPGCGACTAEEPHVNTDPIDNKCDDCGYVLHECVFGGNWLSDASGHWQACTTLDGCVIKGNVGDHYSTDGNNLCDVCGWEMHTCAPGSEWESDDDYHWHVCNVVDGCTTIFDKAIHDDATGDGDHICDICDRPDVSEHIYGAEWEKDENGHWQLCTECGAPGTVDVHEDTDGDHICNVCNYTMSGHSFGSEWKYDENNHWHECACGEKSDSAAHNDSDNDHLCDECDYPMSDHSYGSDWEKDASSHWHQCICGDKIDVADHTDANGDNACDVCGGTICEHIYGTDWEYDETGHWHECSECHHKKDFAAHTLTWVNTDADNHWQACECGHTTTPAAHDHATWVNTDPDNHWKVCECGHTTTPVAHDHTTWDHDDDNHWKVCECGHTTTPVAHDHTTWDHDDDNHWKVCECGHTTAPVAHDHTTWDHDDDTHWKVCECGHTTTPVAHVLTWEHDADNHWEKCECGFTTTPATHTDDATDGDHDCDICGREDAFDHAYGNDWVSDGANHWHECECGEKTDVAPHTDDDGDNLCDICDHIICEHTYGTEWVSDSENHWHECSECGHKKDVAAHTDVTTDTDHKCDICGNDFGAHDHGDDWVRDETGHWHVCDCGDKADFAAHTDSNGDHQCDVCGYVMSGHSFGTAWESDATGHWHKCACGEKADFAAHTDTNGDHKCDICQYVVSEHEFDSEWKSDFNNHWRECDCGQKTDVGAHINSNSDVYCDVCGYMMTPNLSPVHYHFYSWNSNSEGHYMSCYCGNSGDLMPHEDADGDYICDVCGYEMEKPEVEFGCDGGEDCPAATVFTDVNVNEWYHEYVCYVYNAGLMQGMSENEFKPFVTTTRAMLVTTLYRLAGCPEVTGTTAFTDVPEGQWYSDAVLWAEQNEIVYGVSADKFAPCDTLTREQSVAMFYRFAKYLGMDVEHSSDLAEYDDDHKVSSWAEDAMSWSIAVGMIQGRSDNTLAPTDGTKRVELATILTRWCLEIAE